MEIDDVLRPTLLRHLEALKEAFELGHSILVYYAIGMAKRYGIVLESVT